MQLKSLLAALALLGAFNASAQDNPSRVDPHATAASTGPVVASEPEPIMLDTVVVTGSQPGPGLWHVTKAGHELWILGTLTPLPAGITWKPDEIIERLSHSQEVIWPPYFTIDVKAGFFKKLYLGYRWHRAEKNPDGKALQDVLPADVYARWSSVKAHFLPNDRGIERKRPVVAAGLLLDAAQNQSGLRSGGLITQVLKKAITENGLTSTSPHVTVKVTDPSAALKEARRATLKDAACMTATLDLIEKDLPRIVTNANAWATGDLARLGSTQNALRRSQACTDAFSDSDFARKRGIPDIHASSLDAWLKAVDHALATNQATFAVIPISNLIAADGLVERLRARGYTVELPQ